MVCASVGSIPLKLQLPMSKALKTSKKITDNFMIGGIWPLNVGKRGRVFPVPVGYVS
jgi:hypothetical protein